MVSLFFIAVMYLQVKTLVSVPIIVYDLNVLVRFNSFLSKLHI